MHERFLKLQEHQNNLYFCNKPVTPPFLLSCLFSSFTCHPSNINFRACVFKVNTHTKSDRLIARAAAIFSRGAGGCHGDGASRHLLLPGCACARYKNCIEDVSIAG